MKLILAAGHWTPTNMHGVVPYLAGQDITQLVEQKITALVPRKHRPSYTQILYSIESHPTIGQVLVFEIS